MIRGVVATSISGFVLRAVLCATEFRTQSHTTQHRVHTSQPEIFVTTTPRII
jgi:hypothetical protein